MNELVEIIVSQFRFLTYYRTLLSSLSRSQIIIYFFIMIKFAFCTSYRSRAIGFTALQSYHPLELTTKDANVSRDMYGKHRLFNVV